MKQLSSKHTIRIEKKKKKMAALLEITQLNEHDRNAKCLRIPSYDSDNSMREVEPSAKRLCTEESVTNKDYEINRPSCDNVSDADKTSEESDEIGASGKPKLSGEEFIKLKKLLRENTIRLRQLPKFRLREQGEFAAMSVDIENRVPLFLSDIQHLLLHSQIGHHSPYNPARWCQLDKFSKLINTNVLVVDNVSAYHFFAHESQFPFLSSMFNIKLEILNPSMYKGDVVQDLMMVPLTSTQMKRYISSFGTLESAVTHSNDVYDIVKNIFPVDKETASSQELPGQDKFPRTHLLLSGWQMVEENFPLPIKGLMESKYAEYALTKENYKDVSPGSPMFALDCEMCKTTIGDLEVTRVSIVNENLQEVYEQLIKPDNKIVDYLTRFSGITPKLMRNVTKRLQDVQREIQELLPGDAILVGQSLSSDMHALKMMHPYIIDTSVIYNITGERLRKTKLQTLAREFLNIRIQEGRGGHCSVEDSIAAMRLVQHKLTHNLYYGDAVMSNVQLQIRQHPELGHPNYATSMLKQCTRLDKTALVIGLEDIIAKYNYYSNKSGTEQDEKKIKCVTEKSNKSVIKTLCNSLMQYSLNIAHVRVTDSRLQRDKMKAFQRVDNWAKQIYERSGLPSLNVVIFGGQDNANGCCFIKLKTV